MSSNSDEPPQSLLFPPNPSLSSEQPPNSILLNCPGRTPPRPKDVPETTAAEPSLSSSPSSISSRPSISTTSLTTTDSDYVDSDAKPASAVKIHFAPLPTVPPERKRRSSITLGVAARKGMLSGGGPSPRPKVGMVVMNDEEWEAYKKQYEAKSGPEPVDLGQLAKSGAKTLWKKVRSGSQSSTTSTSSVTSDSSSSSSFFGKPRMKRRDSAPDAGPSSILINATPISQEGALGIVHEEGHKAFDGDLPDLSGMSFDESTVSSNVFLPGSDRPHHTMPFAHRHGLVDAEDGDATPRRRPSPPPFKTNKMAEVYDEDEDNENDAPERKYSNSDFETHSEIAADDPRFMALYTDANVRHQQRDAAVLGFDGRTYGPRGR